MPARSIRIGITSRLWAGRADALGAQRESALVLHRALAQAVVSAGALPLLLPILQHEQIEALAELLDGLILQGGGDVSPTLYGEPSLTPDANHEALRDRLEIELMRKFVASGKPVLGLCRGCQLINVAFGGSLFQDLPSQLPHAGQHVDPERYVKLKHEVELSRDGYLRGLYATSRGGVNSAHRQGIRRLADSLEAEATSTRDGLVEAVRWRGGGYVLGVQWHPEFMPPHDSTMLSGAVLFNNFVMQARHASG